MGQVTINLNLLISIVCMFSQLLSGIAYAVQLSHVKPGKIKTGHAPDAPEGFYNGEFYIWFYLFAFCVVSFFFVIVEFALIFKTKYTKLFEICIIRGAFYLFKGIATLGVASDLGIAAAAFEFLAALILIIMEVLARTRPAKE